MMSGASFVPAELVRRVKEAFGCQFSIVFGQTELHGVVTQTHLDDSAEDQSETIGRPLPLVDVKIIDPETGATFRWARSASSARGATRRCWSTSAARADRADAVRRRLAAHGRPRVDGQPRLPDDHRPPQGHDHPRRREHLPAGDRGRPGRAPGRRRRRRHRSARRHVGRAGGGGHRPGRPAPAGPEALRVYCRERLARFKAPSLWYFVADFLPHRDRENPEVRPAGRTSRRAGSARRADGTSPSPPP